MSNEPTPSGLASGETLERAEALLEVTYELLELEDLELLRQVLNKERPADLADLMRRLDEGIRETVFGLLEESLAAEALAESDTHTTLSIVEDMAPQRLSDILDEMEPDDAADVLVDLDREDAEKVLDLMETEGAQEVQDLMAHEEDTGGGIMTSDLISVREEMTVAGAIDRLRQEAEDQDISHLYVTDAEGRPVGVVPVHRLATARPQTPMSRLMSRDLVTVTQETDQEEIARIFSRYNLLAVPVVDMEGRLVGQITVDDVVDVIQEEATEDIYKMAGTSDQEMENPSVFGVARARLPWLLICLLGSFLSGAVIHVFDATLEKVIILASFLPAITATGGNSGLQSSTVTVRGLVTGHVSSGLVLRTIMREIGTAAVIGVACGAAANAAAWLWFKHPLVGICVGVAMFLAISVAVVLGVLVPLLFDRLGIDPAVASGPFITTTNDILGIFIYLGLATVLMGRFM
ncbi:MAG: magnesium transporter [Candidatus Latescibacteria bacterium]|nr:magnesium transporter [Candidatus Latescibacterota bacterium]